MPYLQEAFSRVCSEAKQPEGHYVTLMERVPRYGGNAEGGWWTSDTHIVAYQWFSTREQAEAARDAIMVLAAQLTEESRMSYGDYCLRQMEMLDARGLEPDFLPEDDGPSEFYVLVSEGLPEESRGPTHYE